MLFQGITENHNIVNISSNEAPEIPKKLIDLSLHIYRAVLKTHDSYIPLLAPAINNHCELIAILVAY